MKYNIIRKSTVHIYLNGKLIKSCLNRCGAISVEGCNEIERDLTLPYPKCCQHFKCADGTILKDY